MTVVRIGVGQINSFVGDFEGNADLIIAAAREARAQGVQLLVFPEMALTGFSTEDLTTRGSILDAAARATDRVAAALKKMPMVAIVGGIENSDSLYKGAAVIHRGRTLGFARKRYLFCCGQRDEASWFTAGDRPLVIETDRFRAAVTLGEDLGYPVFPAEVELLINLWNEPYHFGHRPERDRMMIERAREDAVAIVMASPVGGHDELLFEGASSIVDGFGSVVARAKYFEPDLLVADLDLRELKAHRLGPADHLGHQRIAGIGHRLGDRQAPIGLEHPPELAQHPTLVGDPAQGRHQKSGVERARGEGQATGIGHPQLHVLQAGMLQLFRHGCHQLGLAVDGRQLPIGLQHARRLGGEIAVPDPQFEHALPWRQADATQSVVPRLAQLAHRRVEQARCR